jgi:elongation factor 1 alpha-like protein
VSALQLVAAGGVVCHPEWPVPLVSRFAARILVLEPPIPVLQGQQVSKSK